MPKESSFVDDEFDPLLNYSNRFNVAAVQLDDERDFSGKPISLAMLEIQSKNPENAENVQYGEYNGPEVATVWNAANPHPGYP
jgi:hypothetical protein